MASNTRARWIPSQRPGANGPQEGFGNFGTSKRTARFGNKNNNDYQNYNPRNGRPDEICRFGPRCTNQECKRIHENRNNTFQKNCHFGTRCNNDNCKFKHPEVEKSEQFSERHCHSQRIQTLTHKVGQSSLEDVPIQQTAPKKEKSGKKWKKGKGPIEDIFSHDKSNVKALIANVKALVEEMEENDEGKIYNTGEKIPASSRKFIGTEDKLSHGKGQSARRKEARNQTTKAAYMEYVEDMIFGER